MKNHIKSILGVSSFAILVASMPQIAAAQDTNKTSAKEEVVIVTGSSIKRKVLDNALPMQIITKADLEKDGIVTTEQLLMNLAANGTGSDNLATQTDVSPTGTSGRGFNGASAANLRGQGAGATLVLLNGRRVAAHGLKGSAVDVGQIPLAAIERVDVFKDGASAVYGTDAIGGVINFITKKSYQGLNINAFADLTEDGGGNIYKTSILGGWGDLDENHFNIWASASYTENLKLMGYQRDFVKTFQPDRGISTDTRGTPFATIYPLAGTVLTTTSQSTSNAPVIPGSTYKATGGINVLDLPNGAGCNSIARMNAYQDVLWSAPANALACEFDTGQSAALQQPLKATNWMSRASLKLGEHLITAEVMGSHNIANKIYSEYQISSSASAPFAFPRNTLTASTYDSIFNQLVAAFPTLESQRGLPLGIRWRCMACGPRTVETTVDAARYFVGADGPLAADWNYRTGYSYATSEASSIHKSGWYYLKSNPTYGTTGILNLINAGLINPFPADGYTQTADAMAALKTASADGTKVYGGKFTVSQFDGSVSGPMFDMWGGKSYAALGFELRKETYSMGDDKLPSDLVPYLSPIGESLLFSQVSRNVNAIYAELMLPVIPKMELTLAGRYDDYTGFGSVFNPKVSFKYNPFDKFMFRGSYGTGFMVPTFDKVYENIPTPQPYSGKDIVDPQKCPSGVVNPSIAGCDSINFNKITGGNPNLGPEESDQYTLGIVFEPSNDYSLSVDWWKIERTGTVQSLTLNQLVTNYNLFADRFIRDTSGNIVAVDQTYINAGGTLTEGIDVAGRARGKLYDGVWTVSLDGSYLLDKKTKLTENMSYGASEVGQFIAWGDLGLRWKHNLNFSYAKGDWVGSLTQIYKSGYKDQVLPGIKNGTFVAPNFEADVKPYITYNTSLSYKGFKNFTITGGIKNILNTDPPFAIAYNSDYGYGSSWEPRVADPRGRSFTLLLDYKF